MSDTPRTDAVERERCGTHTHWALLQHARQLERELGAAQAKIDRLMIEYCHEEMTPEWGRHQKAVPSGQC